eukprot:CAMPEP_0194135054 /NCGR_PEP_ID=MMETSP0152-20130528/5130_1 /TAXON_ID=1049557 /ORGANISM="Thalassiothrix antarctica, Strain L6-D1" /LENGTH=506 /DNA_ID=CAMNT_0038831081 /DNA_START=116 /DNA_END=1635 /DNA_ORIENTATION=+
MSNEWSQEMTPQPSRPPPPMHVKQSSTFWEEDVSLPSLSDNLDVVLSPGTDSQQSDTFSSDLSLGMRVHKSLKRYVPQSTSKSTSQNNIQQQTHSGKKSLVADLSSDRGSTATESKNDTELDSFLKNQMNLAHQTKQARSDRGKKNIKIARHAPQSDGHLYGEELTRLYKTIEVLSSSNNKLIQEKRDTQVNLSEVMEKCATAENCRHEINENFVRSQEELKKSRLKINELTSNASMQEEELRTLSSKYHDVNCKYESLRSMRERNSYQESEELQRYQKSNEELNIEVRSLLTENRRLRRQAEESNSSLEFKEKEYQKVINERKTLLDRLVKPVLRNAAVQTTTATTTSTQVQTDVLPHSSDYWMDSSMSERLTRIREVSERTSLLREHQKKMDRVTQEHEKALRDMEVRHLQQIHELEEQAVEEHGAKLQQCKRTQATEYQKRLVEMEERHRNEISMIREECNHTLAVTEDSLEVALTQVKAITEQYEHESSDTALSRGQVGRDL